MKKYVPYIIKYPLWFIFKAPQRQLGWITLWKDLIALVRFSLLRFMPAINPKPVSICVGIHNRSELFLEKFIKSLNRVKNPELIELSVFDCRSTDFQNLEHSIRGQWKGSLVFNSEQVKFTRAYTFNKAVKQSSHDIIFICDADFSIPRNIVSMCNRYTGSKFAWFPFVFYLYKDKPERFSPKNGEWKLLAGKGILACLKKDFVDAGMFDEKFVTWGGEDDELWERFYRKGYYIFRSRCRGLLHHWHPSLNPHYQNLEKAEKQAVVI